MPSTWPKSPDLMRNIFDMTRMNMPTSIDVVRDAFYIADISNERMTCVDRSNVVMHSICPMLKDLIGFTKATYLIVSQRILNITAFKQTYIR